MPDMPQQDPERAPSQFNALVQKSAQSARNVANEPELMERLERLAQEKCGPAEDRDEREAKAVAWLLSVGRKSALKEGASAEYQPRAGQPAWIEKALASGSRLIALDLSDEAMERLAGVMDWLRSEQGPGLGSDWSKVSMRQAVEAEGEWVAAMAREAEQNRLSGEVQEQTEPVAGLEDIGALPGMPGELKGWSWARLTGPASLAQEGADLRHCVGSYASAVASNRVQVYSLRDPSGKAIATAEGRGRQFVQLKAFGNKRLGSPLIKAGAALAVWAQESNDLRGALGLPSDFDGCGMRFTMVVGWLKEGEGLSAAQLKELREWKAKRDISDPIWNAALVDAVNARNPQMVQELMPRAGEQPQWMNYSDKSALSAAARLGEEKIFELLLPAYSKTMVAGALGDAAVGGSEAILNAVLPAYKEGSNAVSAIKALKEAVDNKNIAGVKVLYALCRPEGLIGSDRSVIDLGDGNDDLLKAIGEAGSAEIAEVLMRDPSVKKRVGFIFRMACLAGKTELAKALEPLVPEASDVQRGFLFAAQGGSVEMLKALLPRVNPTHNRFEALRMAAEGGKDEAVKELSALADLNLDGVGSSALGWAVEKKHWKTAAILAEKITGLETASKALEEVAKALGLTQDKQKGELFERLLEISDPIHHACPALVECAAAGLDKQALRLMEVIDQKAPESERAMVNEFKAEAFLGAAASGSEALLLALEPYGAMSALKSMPLDRALRNQSWVFAGRLLSALGEDERERLKDMAVALAAERAPLDLLERLCERFNPGANRSEALRAAVKGGRLEAVELLLPYSDAKAMGSEALRMAASQGRDDLVALLLPYSDPLDGDSAPLRDAAGGKVERGGERKGARLECVRLLAGVSDPMARDSEALRHAVYRGDARMAAILLPGSDPLAADSEALRIAMRKSASELIEMLLPVSDPKGGNSECLSIAIERNDLAMAKRLAPLSDANARDCEPLKKALDKCELEMLELVIPMADPERAAQLIKKAGFEDEGEAALLALINPNAPKIKREPKAAAPRMKAW